MYAMFYVRSARALAPLPLSRALPVHADCVAATQRPHASRAAPLPASHARLSTRQNVYAFNQPLSFDTSKVTNINAMFNVRSARALAPLLSRSILVHAACAAIAPRPLTPHRMCPPFDSTERKLPVRRQQAAHPLRVDGHLGLRLRWL